MHDTCWVSELLNFSVCSLPPNFSLKTSFALLRSLPDVYLADFLEMTCFIGAPMTGLQCRVKVAPPTVFPSFSAGVSTAAAD